MMPGLSICGLSDGAAFPIRTIVQKYRSEFEQHMQRQPADKALKVLASFN